MAERMCVWVGGGGGGGGVCGCAYVNCLCWWLGTIWRLMMRGDVWGCVGMCGDVWVESVDRDQILDVIIV